MKRGLHFVFLGCLSLILASLAEGTIENGTNGNTDAVLVGGVDAESTLTQPTIDPLLRKLSISEAILSATESDIGDVMSCFDNNPNTVMRSANINPAFVEIEFPEPQLVRQIRVLLGQPGYPSIDQNSWRVEAADSQEDLDSKTGSYQMPVSERFGVAGWWDEAVLTETIEKRIWRFWITRTVGDDYVHIPELELWTDLDIPDGVDLDVTYISREPRYAWDSDKPLPDLGEPVTFTAHIVNKGTKESGSFDFEWMVDGKTVDCGVAENLPPRSETIRQFTWKWAPVRHHISFQADPQDLIDETSEANNIVEDASDALAIAFWVEQSVYEEFNNRENLIGSYSWEDWARQIIEMANWMFEYSRYPLAPEGILTRIRLDKITIVPDGTLYNLNSAHAPRETTSDGQWGFSVQEYHNAPADWLDVPWWLIHELGHQVFGLVDLYGMDVQDIDLNVLDDRGDPIAGTALLPYLRFDIVHDASRIYDLMHVPTPNSVFSDHSAYYINKYWPKGLRSHRIFGAYIYEIPHETKIRVLDDNAKPMAKVSVAVYQAFAGDGSSGPYSQNFDNIPDIVGVTDKRGLFSIGSKPFPDPEPPRDPEQGHILYNVALIELRSPNSEIGYTWLEVVDLNIAFWNGEKKQYIHDLYFPGETKKLLLSRNKLLFKAKKGRANPAPQNIQVNVLGREVRYWKVQSSGVPWLRTIPSPDIAIGYVEYPSGPLTFIVDSSGLAPGKYSTDIFVSTQSDYKVISSPQKVNVTLMVTTGKKPRDEKFAKCRSRHKCALHRRHHRH
jgi:hypothetical protein